MKLVKRLPPNHEGRDFVIGDLHGALSCLETLLTGLQFDASKDRLISVGDLVDRGPESQGCLELLNEPWFHCVLSNHEKMMLDAFHGGSPGEYWVTNGGFWGIEALNDWFSYNKPAQAERRIPVDTSVALWELLKKVKELPYLLTVERRDGSVFHVIHAELPIHLQRISDEDLADEERLRQLVSITNHNGEFLLWGRWLYEWFYRKDLTHLKKAKRWVELNVRDEPFRDLSSIYSGHTIVTRPLTIDKQTNLDTGAYMSCEPHSKNYCALTCVEPETGRFWQARPNEFREATAVVLSA